MIGLFVCLHARSICRHTWVLMGPDSKKQLRLEKPIDHYTQCFNTESKAKDVIRWCDHHSDHIFCLVFVIETPLLITFNCANIGWKWSIIDIAIALWSVTFNIYLLIVILNKLNCYLLLIAAKCANYSRQQYKMLCPTNSTCNTTCYLLMLLSVGDSTFCYQQ